MNICVMAQELTAAVAKLNLLSESVIFRDPHAASGRLLLSLREDVLTLAVYGGEFELSACLKVQPQDHQDQAELTELNELTVETSQLLEVLGSVTPTERLQLTTRIPASGRLHDHGTALEGLMPTKRSQLQITGHSLTRTLNCTDPFDSDLRQDLPMRQSLLIPQRKLKALLDYSLWCTAPRDWRYFLRGPQFKVRMNEPDILLCTSSNMKFTAALEAKLPKPCQGEKDVRALVPPQSALLLFALLDGESDELVNMQFTYGLMVVKVQNFTFKCRLYVCGLFRLRDFFPSVNAELTVEIDSLKRSIAQVQEMDESSKERLTLLFVNAEDLDSDDSDLTYSLTKDSAFAGLQALAQGKNILRGHRKAKKAAKGHAQSQGSAKSQGNAESQGSAESQSASPGGCLFLEYTNSSQKKARLKVEGSVYENRSCRIVLDPDKILQVLQALSAVKMVRIGINRPTCHRAVFSPVDPDHIIQVAVRYLLFGFR